MTWSSLVAFANEEAVLPSFVIRYNSRVVAASSCMVRIVSWSLAFSISCCATSLDICSTCNLSAATLSSYWDSEESACASLWNWRTE